MVCGRDQLPLLLHIFSAYQCVSGLARQGPARKGTRVLTYVQDGGRRPFSALRVGSLIFTAWPLSAP